MGQSSSQPLRRSSCCCLRRNDREIMEQNIAQILKIQQENEVKIEEEAQRANRISKRRSLGSNPAMSSKLSNQEEIKDDESQKPRDGPQVEEILEEKNLDQRAWKEVALRKRITCEGHPRIEGF
ncbi:unnamed protein product [Moneuplotes crassus]|uniref:Uncharacterized protein n=1 Tax=Euplotes crassus TaxID=5936 RepID=A0AAD1XTC5_EUPCR|nr:unnamed protein product [Moneuplotes crassus]